MDRARGSTGTRGRRPATPRTQASTKANWSATLDQTTSRRTTTSTTMGRAATVQLFLLLRKLLLQLVDLVDELFLKGLVLPGHVRCDRERRALLLLEVFLHLLHFRPELHLCAQCFLGLGRLDPKLALEGLALHREVDILLLGLQGHPGIRDSLFPSLLPHRRLPTRAKAPSARFSRAGGWGRACKVPPSPGRGWGAL